MKRLLRIMILQFFVTFLIKLRVRSQALFHFSLFNVSTTQYVSTVGFTATACNKVVLNKGANIGNFEDQVGRIISGKNLFPFSITFNDEIIYILPLVTCDFVIFLLS